MGGEWKPVAGKRDCYATGISREDAQKWLSHPEILRLIEKYRETDADAHAEQVWHDRYDGTTNAD